MSDIIWALVYASPYLAVFISWFFLIAFLFNLSTSINKKNKSSLVLSFIMMVSYFMTNLIDMSVATHMDYLLFDVSTIFIIIVFNFFSPWEKPAAFYYLIVGLSINASLYLMMHYDINIAKTLEYWWFWALYAFWVYINDFLMALVLILNKDFLRLAKFINHNFSNKVVS